MIDKKIHLEGLLIYMIVHNFKFVISHVTLENSSRYGRGDARSKGCAAMANDAVKLNTKGGAQRTLRTGTWVHPNLKERSAEYVT